MHRRARFGVALVALLLLTGGCLDLATGGTATFESSQATVSAETLDDTGYTLTNSTTENVTQNVSAAGQERTVRVTNHVAQYSRNVSLGPLGEHELARFAVLSTPAVEVAGQTFNPVGSWSQKRLVNELSSQYSGLEDVSHVDNRSVRVLGDQRTVAKFSARATVAGGQEMDAVVHVTRFRHDDDFVVAIGVHPERLSDERERVDGMFRGVDH